MLYIFTAVHPEGATQSVRGSFDTLINSLSAALRIWRNYLLILNPMVLKRPNHATKIL